MFGRDNTVQGEADIVPVLRKFIAVLPACELETVDLGYLILSVLCTRYVA
jgi:hypothetical protein